MKKIFTLFASLLLGIAVFAADARNASTIMVKSVLKGNIRVLLDGKRFEPNGSSLIVSNVDAGTHTIKIYRQRSAGLFGTSRFDLVYNSNLSVKKNTSTIFTIENSGYASIQQTKIARGRGGRDEGYSYNDKDGRFDYGTDGQFGDYDSHEAYNAGMNDRDFNSVLVSINKEWLESNKLKSASQIVRTNSLTTAQVKQLLGLFSFENNKLDLAKQAYANTVDKKNYRSLYECFNMASSRNDLERYTQFGR